MIGAEMLGLVIQVGRQAALAAGAVLRRNFSKPHDITLKSAIDPVTESDLASQQTIIRLIRQTFPDHGFLAEEAMVDVGERAGTSGPCPSPQLAPPYRWIIDPLDGTVYFAHGFPMFCVSIAFEEAGVVEYGVVYDPLRDELFEARRGLIYEILAESNWNPKNDLQVEIVPGVSALISCASIIGSPLMTDFAVVSSE